MLESTRLVVHLPRSLEGSRFSFCALPGNGYKDVDGRDEID
jgi:hypothetical protein